MTGLIPLLLIIINVVVSYRALKDVELYERYVFEVEKVLVFKQYYRLLSSGFLHVNWLHLIFNMLALYLFSGILINAVGEIRFLLIYALALIGGDLFALFIHINEPSYRSVGASAAVNGVIFASIGLFPNMRMGLFFIPLSIPSWIFGFLYVIYCIYGMRSRTRGVAHDAHFGGAIIGLLVALLMYPESIRQNYLPILLILIPSIAFIYLLAKRPHFLLLKSNYGGDYKYTIDQRYNKAKKDQQQELDRLLDKISRGGMGSLSRKEKEDLKRLSKGQY